MREGFGFRELRAPRIDLFGLTGITRFDQGSTESHPTGKSFRQAIILANTDRLEVCATSGPLISHKHHGGFSQTALARSVAFDGHLRDALAWLKIDPFSESSSGLILFARRWRYSK